MPGRCRRLESTGTAAVDEVAPLTGSAPEGATPSAKGAAWAARPDGDRPELIRAALTSIVPMLHDRDAREVRERVIARRAPTTVRDRFAVRSLRKLAAHLDLVVQGYGPAMQGQPALRDGAGGIKVFDR